jgi:hypothetical protein
VFGLLTVITRLTPSSIGNWVTLAKLTVLASGYFFGAALTLVATGLYSVYLA